MLAAAVFAACPAAGPAAAEQAEDAPLFPAGFSTADAGLLTLAVAGVFLIAAAGLADLAAGMGVQGLPVWRCSPPRTGGSGCCWGR